MNNNVDTAYVEITQMGYSWLKSTQSHIIPGWMKLEKAGTQTIDPTISSVYIQYNSRGGEGMMSAAQCSIVVMLGQCYSAATYTNSPHHIGAAEKELKEELVITCLVIAATTDLVHGYFGLIILTLH